jgi:hypothetical protein
MKTLAKEIEDLKFYYAKENSDYTKFIKGKTIAIVGPSQSMINSNLGTEIDSFDYVTRFNSAIFNFKTIKLLSKDIGSRTDISYLAKHIILDWKKDTTKEVVDNNIRFLIAAEPSGNKDVEQANTYLEQKLLNLKIKTSNSHKTSSFLNNHLSVKERRIARVGFISIVDLLLRGAKHISIYGMTFYHGGGNILRKDAIYDIDPESNHLGINENTHDSTLELDLFKKIYNLYDSYITIDKELLKLMNIQSPK